MIINVPPSETEQNAASIRRAVHYKEVEVENARRKLSDLQAELRGLQAALDLIAPKTQK